jgi:hypothetical protein
VGVKVGNFDSVGVRDGPCVGKAVDKWKEGIHVGKLLGKIEGDNEGWELGDRLGRDDG